MTTRWFIRIAALAVCALPLLSLAGDFPKGSPKFASSYRSALTKAKKEGKPVILIFSATWCGPCQKMKKDVYPSAAVTPLQDKFVWAYLDVDDKSNSKAAEKYKVNGIPHIEFVDAEGNSLGQQVGGSAPEAFAKKLEEISTAAAESGKKE